MHAFMFSFFVSMVCCVPITKEKKSGSNDLTETTFRVVNGVPVTDENEYPFVVDLSAHAVAISSSRFCTGTLIKQNVLLTAAHCVLNDGYSNPVYATVGRIELEDDHKANDKARTFRTIASIVHPEYQGLGSAKDIAVMLLNESSTAPTVSLSDKTPKENEETWVVGYGIQNIGTLEEAGQHVELMSGRLQKTALRIKENSFCDIPGTDFWTQDGMLCTAGVKAGSSACKGDSGGGLFLHRSEKSSAAGHGTLSKKTIQVGVVSYGDAKCMSEDSGVFTDVASVKDWIDLAASRLQNAFHTVRIQMKDKVAKEILHDGAGSSDDKLPFVTRTSRKDRKGSYQNSKFYAVQTDFTSTRVVTAALCDESSTPDSNLFVASDIESKLVTERWGNTCPKGNLSKLSFTAMKGTYLVGVTSGSNMPIKLALSSSEKE